MYRVLRFIFVTTVSFLLAILVPEELDVLFTYNYNQNKDKEIVIFNQT